jgi:YidC/Oxa1 family membrane protein insertase
MQSQDPDNHNNLMLAVVLSMAVLLMWQLVFPPPKPPPQSPSQQTEATGTSPGSLGTPGIAGGPGQSEAGAAKSPRVAIKTPSIEGSIALRGARIDDVQLVNYHDTPDPSSPKVVLLQPSDSKSPYFSEHGWLAPGGATVPNKDTVWSVADGAQLTAEQPLVLTWDNGAGLTFKRTISVDENYLFTIADEVSNNSGSDVVLHPYGRLYRHGTPEIEGFFVQHEGIIAWLGETERLQQFTYSGILDEEKPETFSNITGGWLGFTDKYWAATLVPDQEKPYSVKFWAPSRKSSADGESFQTEYQQGPVTVVNGGTAKVSSRLFAGAKQVGLIGEYQTKFNILDFDYLIDWGWFFFITKPLYFLLNWLYGLFGNFGLAILATTVIVKAAFFPLANRAYVSMAQMKKLQPEMERLKKQYPDDKQKQQQEMMALYQKEKINPLAGCFPILLQIPVFFALYKVLFVSIDMRHAPFYGWITDLSAPDPTSIFNLFGLLPFAVPEFLMIGVWPLIMGITMWLQMQLNPSQPDPTQQMIFNWMPVMFTFLLATFPAGLVIYWAWNNILSLIQQYAIMKRQGAEVPLIDNLKKTFAAVGDLIPKRKSE